MLLLVLLCAHGHGRCLIKTNRHQRHFDRYTTTKMYTGPKWVQLVWAIVNVGFALHFLFIYITIYFLSSYWFLARSGRGILQSAQSWRQYGSPTITKDIINVHPYFIGKAEATKTYKGCEQTYRPFSFTKKRDSFLQIEVFVNRVRGGEIE